MKLLLKSLPLTHLSTWKETLDMIKSYPTYQDDEYLQAMDPLDMLTCFEDHIMKLDSEIRQNRSTRIRALRRKERQNRDEFQALLLEMKNERSIHAKSKWKDLYPLIKYDPRFSNMLGQLGSNPLDLFWDMLMDLEEQYRTDKRFVVDFLAVRFILLYN